MKKNKTDSIRRKIISNYVFCCTEGPYVLLSLFYRMGLIQRPELEILCSRLLDTPFFEKKISEYMDGYKSSVSCDDEDDFGCDDTDEAENSFVQERQPENHKLTANSPKESEQITEPTTDLYDLVVGPNDKEEFLIFRQVCDKMKCDGYLNGVDLPSALSAVAFFSPTIAIKATELNLFNFDDESYLSLKKDIECYRTPLCDLSLEEKFAWLSFCVAKASDDIQANSDLKNANMLRNDLVNLLSGIPEYFYNKKIEELNHTIIRQESEDKGTFLKKYFSSRLRSCFVDHVLPLEKHLQITKAMYYLEKMSFDDEKSFCQKARPIILQALHGMPLSLKKEYMSVFSADTRLISFEAKNLKKNNSWLCDMVNYTSRCFEISDPQKMITKEEMLVKLSDLTRLTNIAIAMNNEWSMSEKDTFWDVLAAMKIKQVPSTVSKYKTLQKFSMKGHSRD